MGKFNDLFEVTQLAKFQYGSSFNNLLKATFGYANQQGEEG